jgi:hypothetical protein
LEIVKILLDHRADIHASYGAALRASSSSGHVDIIKLLLKDMVYQTMLLDHKADIHAEEDYA